MNLVYFSSHPPLFSIICVLFKLDTCYCYPQCPTDYYYKGLSKGSHINIHIYMYTNISMARTTPPPTTTPLLAKIGPEGPDPAVWARRALSDAVS